jgi:glycogen debranching enzyme
MNELGAPSPFSPGCTDPDLVTLFKGWVYLSTAPHGDFSGRRLQGFFAAGTCFVDLYRLSVNGRTPRCTFGAPLSSQRWSGVYIVPGSAREGDLPAGAVPVGALDLSILRAVDDGWTETLTLENHSERERTVDLVLEWNCPLSDSQAQERSKLARTSPARGLTARVAWQGGNPSFHYRKVYGRRRRAPTAEFRALYGRDAPKDGDPVERSLEVRLSSDGASAAVSTRSRTRVRLRRTMAARETWTVRLEFLPRADGRPVSVRDRRSAPPTPTRIRTGSPVVNAILERAAEDLDALALPALGSPDGVPPGLNAGVPRYIGVFGRDMLTAGWQASLRSCRYNEDALARVALYRGVRGDEWRDEEPDRILHERRANPDAELGRSNRELYYGDVAATPFWVVTLASAYNWNGNRDFLRRQAPTLRACVRWIRRKLREGNGFVYYESRSSEPNRNQGWKDSGDAIVDARGRVHVPPLAVAEVQGYCFLALLSAAELALALGRAGDARGLYREAMELRRRFNAAFWLPREEFVALALDRDGRPIEGIGSNAGHCLGCGILEGEKAAPVARRLLADDLFSGWGIRTLSRLNPAYDPFSYHRGSVWPVENATISAGLRLCGFDDEAARVIHAQFSAAACFPALRLPEVLSGHERSAERPLPGLYPEANLLQAWSVSSVFFYVWVLLGLRPLAPLRTLLVKPLLPEWLPWVEIDDLRVGDAVVSLAFQRTARGGVRWKVLEKKGRLLILEQPMELAGAGLGRRLRDAFRSVI